ncbi:MAG: transglycosylase domain-containing protein [Alphaproteobacteria bacterium]|nr:transglycosylase domain-containing protein [Alphaproteobacteria bacterium]
MYFRRMRVVFIFIVICVLIGLTVPIGFAVRWWMDGQAVLAEAERDGAIWTPESNRLTVIERTVAMDQFRDTWLTHAAPCRTLAFAWYDLTDQNPPDGFSVSQRLATDLPSERRERSIRWHIGRLVVACQLEQRFNDRQLLRLWLAHAYFGRDAEGVEAASQLIFDKPSAALNAEEAAKLAALLRGPGLRSRPEDWATRARAIQERVAGTTH